MTKQVALITGAGSRIGYAIAEHLAKKKYDLALHCNSKSIDRINSSNDQLITYHQADFSNTVDLQQCIDEVWLQHSHLNVIINNASTFPNQELPDLDSNTMLHTFAVNCVAPLLLIQALSQQERCGHVINILDCRIGQQHPKRLAYSLSKHALGQATKHCAYQLAPKIRVNAICPGPVFPPVGESTTVFKDIVQKTPLQQLVEIDNICAAVDYLANNNNVTGELLFVDSGQHLT